MILKKDKIDIKIIDNFLEKTDFKNLQNIILGDNFPWYFNDFKSDGVDIANYQFTHTIIRNGQVTSDFIRYIDCFFKKINTSEFKRIKLNLTTRTEKIFNHKFHTDFKDCTTSIFYFNTTNGKTTFKTGEEVDCVENRMITFNSNLEHAAMSHTNEKIRVVMNLNYLL